MHGFHGKYDYSVDAKGRLNIPAKFRKALALEAAETFIVCQGPDRCLRAFPQNFWGTYVAELNARPEMSDTVGYKRQFYNNVSDSTLDAQGRITLMPNQMEIAGISRAVTLIGHENYIEIWDPERYSSYLEKNSDFDTAFYQSVQAGLLKK